MDAETKARQLRKGKEDANRAKLMQWENDSRAQQALAAKAASKGKGGKGKGGKGKGGMGKGGKGVGAGSLPAFVPSLPKQNQETEHIDSGVFEKLKEIVQLDAGHTTPSADALDLGEEAFPALGGSKMEKSVEVRKEAVSSGGSQAASMNKFMRKTYGCVAPC